MISFRFELLILNHSLDCLFSHPTDQQSLVMKVKRNKLFQFVGGNRFNNVTFFYLRAPGLQSMKPLLKDHNDCVSPFAATWTAGNNN